MSSALATKPKPTNGKPDLKVVQPPARTLAALLAQAKAGPSPHSEWSRAVDNQVGALLSKKGEVDSRLNKAAEKHPGASRRQLFALVRRDARDEVLANDRSYWM